jgi:hypothetical protein
VDDGIDLDGNPARKNRDTHGGTRMPASLSEQGDEKIRSAIGHFRLLREAGRRIHEHAELHEPDHPLETPNANVVNVNS